MVRKGGFEPPRLSAPPPQDGVSANSTTSANLERFQRFIGYLRPTGRGVFHRKSFKAYTDKRRKFKPSTCRYRAEIDHRLPHSHPAAAHVPATSAGVDEKAPGEFRADR